MANPDLTNPLGTINWQNNINTVREADLERLQARAVVRFNSQGDAASADPPHSEEGSVIYDVSVATIKVKATGSTWKQVVAAANLEVFTDTGSAVAIRHKSAPGGISLSNMGVISGAVFAASEKLTTPRLEVTGGAVLTDSGSALAFSGRNVSFTTNVAASGTLSVSGNTTLSSLSANSANFSTSVSSATLTLSGGLTGTTASFSGAVTSNASVTVSGTALTSTGLSKSGSGAAIVIDSHLTLRNPSGEIRLDDGSALKSRVAGWVVSTLAPTPEQDYPDGTIWLETT